MKKDSLGKGGETAEYFLEELRNIRDETEPAIASPVCYESNRII
jgi:hypothetical protein